MEEVLQKTKSRKKPIGGGEKIHKNIQRPMLGIRRDTPSFVQPHDY